MTTIIVLILLGQTAFSADKFHVRSGSEQINLVELYSSEGCSSCPPKDAWFGTLRNKNGLWKMFVPVAFHVDYWNHLGWRDPYSKSEFTERQKRYASEWGNQRIYTPGLILNGLEWQRNPGDQGFANTSLRKGGILEVWQLDKTQFRVNFKPILKDEKWHLFGAILANGVSSQVKNGENEGRELHHEFVAISLTDSKMKSEGSAFEAELHLSIPSAFQASSYSAVFWVAKEGTQKAIQAVGGDLSNIKNIGDNTKKYEMPTKKKWQKCFRRNPLRSLNELNALF